MKGFKKIFTFFSLLYSPMILAGTIPIFDKVTTGYDSGGYWIVAGEPRFILGPDWTNYSSKESGAALVVYNKEKNTFQGFPGHTWWGGIMHGPTMGQLLSYAVNQDRNRGTLRVKNYVALEPSNYCVTYQVMLASSGVVYPDCIQAPQVPAACKITTSEILLDYKTIKQVDMEGSAVEAFFNINCSNSGKVNFSLSNGKNTIGLGGGVSTITINDLPLKTSVNVSSGDNNFKIKSILKNVKPGSWQGSSVLVLEPL